MSSLPVVTGLEAIRAFGRVGFVLDRIKGSHHILRRDGHRFVLSVPVHGTNPIAKGTLRSLIRTAGLTIEQFCRLLE